MGQFTTFITQLQLFTDHFTRTQLRGWACIVDCANLTTVSMLLNLQYLVSIFEPERISDRPPSFMRNCRFDLLDLISFWLRHFIWQLKPIWRGLEPHGVKWARFRLLSAWRINHLFRLIIHCIWHHFNILFLACNRLLDWRVRFIQFECGCSAFSSLFWCVV